MKTLISTAVIHFLISCTCEAQASSLLTREILASDRKFLTIRSGDEPKEEKEETFADRMGGFSDGFTKIAGDAAGGLGSAAGTGIGAIGNVTDKLQGKRSQKPTEYLKCGVTHRAGSSNDKYEICPTDCPYFAQNREDDEPCTFLCVPGDQCSKWNPAKPIPGNIKDSNVCRGPVVQFCTRLTLDGKDTCAECQYGWTVWPGDGQCYFTYWKIIYSIGIFICILLVVVVIYAIDWCCRETINPEGVKTGEKYRSQAKILIPKSRVGEYGVDKRCVYPSNTNLCREDIAGPGMLLHFNFQAFFVGWPLMVAILWTILAHFHEELFIMGTRKFGTPRHNCILVAWGYETQQRLMWTKVIFLMVVYVGSFIAFILFSVRQYRMYEEMDAKEKTMKDFVAEVEGLQRVPGEKSVESDIVKALEDAGCKGVLGVSVCWNYGEKEDDIMNEVAADQVAKENYPEVEVGDPTANMGFVHKKMYAFENMLFGPAENSCYPKSTDTGESKVEDWLTKLETSTNAFVVFKTEQERDNALQDATVAAALKTKQYKLCGQDHEGGLELISVNCEPTTVNWGNYADTSMFGMVKRFFLGFFCIYVPALAVWFFGFYVPYAYSLYNFNYENGAELPTYYGLLFTIIVVGGNATMYIVCDLVGDKIGFKYKDSKQVAYMIMYLVACTLNVLLDMGSTYYVVYKSMVGLDFRDYFGKKLEDYTTFTEVFETYAMQRSLAENVKLYAFPGTMLIPFLIEPIVTIYVPLKIGRLVVRTHREIQGRLAESLYELCIFDLGRYADILLNIFLGILIFWFPGGFTCILFYGMAGSHAWIYCFDHYKVLHCIPLTKIVSKEVDDWAQVIMAGLCGMILSALVFKSNCEPYNMHGYCMQGYDLIYATVFAGVGHFVLHLFLLGTLVPYLGDKIEQRRLAAGDQKEKDAIDNMTFDQVATDEAFTWFSSNPVHCLRSKFVHKDAPYCRYVSPGKEHLLEQNTKINCYFTDKEAEVEDFDEKDNIKNFASFTHQAAKDIYARIKNPKGDLPASSDPKSSPDTEPDKTS
jgi:hypothetical protein